jgi:bacillithiol system protein YtxJ
MSLLNKLFGGSKEPKSEKILPWIPLNDIQQIDHIINKSSAKTQVIFKHSTRCGISRMVMSQFIDMFNLAENDLDLYYLDLLNYRSISDKVGVKFMIMHESPQLIVIKNGVAVTHASHGAVNNIVLQEYK